jgi:hypothetical protein
MRPRWDFLGLMGERVEPVDHHKRLLTRLSADCVLWPWPGLDVRHWDLALVRHVLRDAPHRAELLEALGPDELAGSYSAMGEAGLLRALLSRRPATDLGSAFFMALRRGDLGLCAELRGGMGAATLADVCRVVRRDYVSMAARADVVSQHALDLVAAAINIALGADTVPPPVL